MNLAKRAGLLVRGGLLAAALLVWLVPGFAVAADLKNAAVEVSPKKTGAVAQYTLGFYVSGSGALTGGRDEITIYFPEGTVIPAAFSRDLRADSIIINGYSVDSRYVYASEERLIVTLPPEVNVRGYGYVGVIIAQSTGIELPRKAGNHYLEVETTRDGRASTNSFTIEGSSISRLDLTASPAAVDQFAAFEFSFRTGSAGALVPEEDAIYIEFDSEISLPRSIAGGDVEVDGIKVQPGGVTVEEKTKTVKIVVPPETKIGGRNTVEVKFDSRAGIRNPRKAGTYRVNVYTSKDSESVGESYRVGMSLLSPVVSVSPNQAGEKSQYSIGFTTSANGSLQAGKDYLYLEFPSDTYIPNGISTSYVTVNGFKAQAVDSSRSKRTVTIKVPYGITIGDATYVSIVFKAEAGIKNPDKGGEYRLEVSTSADSSMVKSKAYTVVGKKEDETSDGTGSSAEDEDEKLKVVLSAYGTGKYASVKVSFQADAFGTLSRGDKIYFLFPSNFTVPGSIKPEEVKVNGLITEGLERMGQALVVTLPGGFDLINKEKIEISINPGVGIKTPAQEGVYSFFLYSSREINKITDYKVKISNNVQDTEEEPGDKMPAEGNIVFKIGSKTAYHGKKVINLDVSPTIIKDFTVVPLRALGDALGAETAYDGATRTVTVKYAQKVLVFYIDSNLVKVNDSWVVADIPATLLNNRVMIPARFVSQSFGAAVVWNEEAREVIITK